MESGPAECGQAEMGKAGEEEYGLVERGKAAFGSVRQGRRGRDEWSYAWPSGAMRGEVRRSRRGIAKARTSIVEKGKAKQARLG